MDRRELEILKEVGGNLRVFEDEEGLSVDIEVNERMSLEDIRHLKYGLPSEFEKVMLDPHGDDSCYLEFWEDDD